MSIHFYRDDGGCVGEPDPPEDMRDAADAACITAFSAAEDLAMELDRAHGDAGERPDALLSLAARITALAEEARALLGRKPRLIRDRNGFVVGRVL